MEIILGGPGSGKSRSLVSRAVQLVRDGGVPGDRLLVLAPTRRAADAVAALARESDVGARPVSTSFSGLALTILRDNFRALGFDGAPRVLTTSQQFESLRAALRAEDPTVWHHFRGALSSRTLCRYAYDVLVGAAESRLGVAELHRRSGAWNSPGLGELADFAERFRANRRREGVTDYGEALTLAAELLEGQPRIAAALRDRFAAVFVDEFEDASAAHIRLLDALVGGEIDLTVAGDPEQGLASYRGGSPAHLLALAERPDARIVRLADTRRAPGTLRAFAHPVDEARFIADEVVRLARAGTPLVEIAVVCRSLESAVPRLIAAELRRRGVPFDAPAGHGILGEPLVRALADLLRYLLAPTPDLAFRLLDSPLAALPPFGLARLRAAAHRSGMPLESLVEAGGEGLDADAETSAALISLRGNVGALRERLARGRDDTADLVFEAWRHFAAFREDALGEGRAAAAVRSLLDELARRGQNAGSGVTLDGFVRLLDDGAFDGLVATRPRRPGLTICTVHAAKGRTWDVVFLSDLVEDVFPLRRLQLTLAPLLDSDLPATPLVDESEPAAATNHLLRLRRERQDAEERRVFNVATSRARRALYLSHSRRGADGETSRTPSRFLEGLADVVTVENPAAEELAPLDLGEAIAHYRRLLADPDPLARAEAAHALRALADDRPDAVRPAAWWENVVETTGAAPPHPEGRLYLSASKLGSYRDCPLAYQYGYEWRVGEVSGAALTTGSTLHAVLEEYHRPGSQLARSRESLIACLDRHFKAEDYPYKPVARQERVKLERLLDAYFARYGADGDALAVERGFRFDLAGHALNGYIDRVDRLADQTLELIDYKSGAPMTKADAESDLQLALYDLAFHNDPELAALGVPSLVSYVYPKDLIGAGPRKTGKRSYVPTDASREALAAHVAASADGILAERFPAYREIVAGKVEWDAGEVLRLLGKDPCRYCAFDWICPAAERGGIEEE